MTETDQTKSPVAQVRNLIRDTFHALDLLQNAAANSGGALDLTNTIAALKYAHNAIHKAFESLIQ